MQINIHNVVERTIQQAIADGFNLARASQKQFSEQELQEALSLEVMSQLCDVIDFEEQYHELKEKTTVNVPLPMTVSNILDLVDVKDYDRRSSQRRGPSQYFYD